jgi:hypothetical protein
MSRCFLGQLGYTHDRELQPVQPDKDIRENDIMRHTQSGFALWTLACAGHLILFHSKTRPKLGIFSGSQNLLVSATK